jgi:Uma2 family endonuclease
MAIHSILTKPPRKPVPIAPEADQWARMSLSARERWLIELLDTLTDPESAMSEGRPHKKAKSQAADKLGLHFASIGRVVYLAEEMAVVYPGERPITPDVLAVLDVAEPVDDQRMAWVVLDEGKGVDLVLEVLHHGDRKKDLEENVERYAHLGIPEYFVYDRLRQRVVGYRLPPGASKYQPIIPQFGRYASRVLGLDLAIEHGELRFFHGMAELFGSDELIGRLKSMVQDLEAKANQAQTQVDQAFADGLRQALLTIIEARDLPCPDDARGRILACTDVATLQRWVLRVATSSSVEEALKPA